MRSALHAGRIHRLGEEGQGGSASGGNKDGPDGLSGLGVLDLLGRPQHLVGEVERLMGSQAGAIHLMLEPLVGRVGYRISYDDNC